MRTLTYSAMVSLDGYIEDADGSIGWSAPDEEVHRYANDSARECGLQIMGRKLYDMMIPYWPDVVENPSGVEFVDEFAAVWVPLPKLVYSRTMESAEANTEVRSEIDPEEIRELKATPGGPIDIGGAELASAFAELGLIDEVEMIVHPTITGGGKPFFGPGFGGKGFGHISSRSFPSGIQIHRYSVEP